MTASHGVPGPPRASSRPVVRSFRGLACRGAGVNTGVPRLRALNAGGAPLRCAGVERRLQAPERLLQQRSRTRQVHPGEAPSLRTEDRPVLEAQLGFVQQEGLEVTCRNAGAPEVEPGEIRPLDGSGSDIQFRAVAEEGPQGPGVFAQVGEHLVEPRPPTAPGGFRGRRTERIHPVDAGPVAGAPEGVPHFLVRDHEAGGLEAREVERLARRRTHDRSRHYPVLQGPVLQAEPGGEGSSVQHQIRMDLVGHHDEVVSLRDPRELAQLPRSPDPAHRVLRTAQERHSRLRLRRQLLEPLEIEPVRIPRRVFRRVLRRVLPAERTQVHAGAGVPDRPEEREIDRRVKDDPLPRLEKGADEKTQVGNDSLGRHDPLGVRSASVPGRHPVAKGRAKAQKPHAVAEDRMLRAAANRFDHDVRTGEVHVGDPHGDHVGILRGNERGTVTDRALAVLPFHRPGPRAGNEPVEGRRGTHRSPPGPACGSGPVLPVASLGSGGTSFARLRRAMPV